VCVCVYRYTATLQHQYIARLAIESRQQTPEEMVMEEQRQRALVKRNKEARVSLVHEGSFLPLPGLITVFRGHRGNVACLKIRRVGTELRVFSGGADGTLRMWDLRTAKPLMVIKAHSLPVLGLDLLAVEAREQQQNSSEVLSRTYDPKWSSFANKFKFTIANIHQMICIHLFAATKGGDVQIGNSAVLLHEVFGTGLDAGGNVCKRDLDLPLIQLLPDRDLLQQSQKVQRSEEDVVEEMNGAGAGADAQLALLDAAVICKRGLRADLRYRKTGSVQVSIEYRAMESSLEVHVREAQIRGTKVPQKQMNAYHTVIVKVPPQLRVFTVGGSVAHMFDVQSQRLIHAFEGHTTTITCVLTRRIRACDFLFTASLDKTVRMWNIESGDTLRTFMGHLDGITSILLSHDVMQAKKVMDDRPYRGKANLVLRIKYSQNESFQMDLEVEILALEGLPLDPKAAKQLKFFARVEVSPGHLPNTEALVYKKGMWKMSRTTHHFNDVQLTAHVDITLIVRKGGRNDCYLGSIETTVAAIDRRICQEVGLDANTLTSSYPVSFDMPQQVHLFTGAGLGDGQIRQFETFPRTDSNVLPVKVFKGHSQSVTGLDFIDDVYGQRCLVSCSWDGTCKLWSVQMEDKATALETFVVADGNMHNHAVTITHYPANKSVWIVVGSNDRCVRLVKVSKKAIEAKSWRSVLAEWLDSLPVFGVIIFCIILDVSTGVVTDFAMAKHDKDCFGRDSQGSLLVTAFVLSIFCAELLLRMIAQGIDFVVPVRICFWNYLEVLLIFGSSGVAVMKAISDIRDEAPFPQGAEVPVISCNAYPELCEGYCGDFQATKELSSVTEARKGTTAARILTRFAIGLRLLRAGLSLSLTLSLSLSLSLALALALARARARSLSLSFSLSLSTHTHTDTYTQARAGLFHICT
jgi:WD40 repeat protein